MLFVALFCFAFVRKKRPCSENLDDKKNDFLLPYRKIVEEGLRYINETTSRRVYVVSFDGLKLSARFFPCAKSDTVIILFHGYRSSAARDMSCAVKMYNEMGLDVLLVDQRSHGQSEGRLITFGVKERYDVISWIDFTRKNMGEDKKIFISGISMGATTVLLASELNLPVNVKGIIADCGFTSPVEIIKKVSKEQFGIRGVFIIPIMNAFCRIFGGFGLYGVSTETALKSCRIPILFVHGGADGFVPCEMSLKAYATADCEKQILIVDDADHGMSFLVDMPNVRKKLQNFIENNRF